MGEEGVGNMAELRDNQLQDVAGAGTSKVKKYCKKCGGELEPFQNFLIDDSPEDKLRCTKCGDETFDSDWFYDDNAYHTVSGSY